MSTWPCSVCMSHCSGGSRISDRGLQPHTEGKGANLSFAQIRHEIKIIWTEGGACVLRPPLNAQLHSAGPFYATTSSMRPPVCLYDRIWLLTNMTIFRTKYALLHSGFNSCKTLPKITKSFDSKLHFSLVLLHWVAGRHSPPDKTMVFKPWNFTILFFFLGDFHNSNSDKEMLASWTGQVIYTWDYLINNRRGFIWCKK